MGTNYYLMIDEEDNVDVNHIGKMTTEGFLLRQYKDVYNYDDWVVILENIEHCFDESGAEISTSDMLKMIKEANQVVEEFFC